MKEKKEEVLEDLNVVQEVEEKKSKRRSRRSLLGRSVDDLVEEEDAYNSQGEKIDWDEVYLELETGHTVYGRLIPNLTEGEPMFAYHRNRTKVQLPSLNKPRYIHSRRNQLDKGAHCELINGFFKTKEAFGEDSLELEEYKAAFNRKSVGYFYFQVIEAEHNPELVGKMFIIRDYVETHSSKIAKALNPDPKMVKRGAKPFNPYDLLPVYQYIIDSQLDAKGQRNFGDSEFDKELEKMGILVPLEKCQEAGLNLTDAELDDAKTLFNGHVNIKLISDEYPEDMDAAVIEENEKRFDLVLDIIGEWQDQEHITLFPTVSDEFYEKAEDYSRTFWDKDYTPKFDHSGSGADVNSDEDDDEETSEEDANALAHLNGGGSDEGDDTKSEETVDDAGDDDLPF